MHPLFRDLFRSMGFPSDDDAMKTNPPKCCKCMENYVVEKGRLCLKCLRASRAEGRPSLPPDAIEADLIEEVERFDEFTGLLEGGQP